MNLLLDCITTWQTTGMSDGGGIRRQSVSLVISLARPTLGCQFNHAVDVNVDAFLVCDALRS